MELPTMRYAEDYKVGESYYLGSHQITADEIVAFAKQYDPQPYHLSPEEGERSFFRGLVASGWNTASIWMRLYVGEMLGNSSVQGSPGVDELRWDSPVRPGDWLHGSVAILEAVPNPFKRDIVTLKKQGILRRNDEVNPVMTLILHSRFVRRPASPESDA
jgi:acyl dehydratase